MDKSCKEVSPCAQVSPGAQDLCMRGMASQPPQASQRGARCWMSCLPHVHLYHQKPKYSSVLQLHFPWYYQETGTGPKILKLPDTE